MELTKIQRRTLKLYAREGHDRQEATRSLIELTTKLMAEDIAKRMGNNCLVMSCLDCGSMTSLDKETMTFYCPKCKTHKPVKPQTLLQHLERGGTL